MAEDVSNEAEQRVLLLAPTRKDVDLTQSLLQRAAITCVACKSLGDLIGQIEVGVAAVLLAEDAITPAGIGELSAAIEKQPAWSDIPVIILIQGGSASPGRLKALESLRNVTLLERPAPMRSVVGVVQTAIRARRRQYQIRDHFTALREANARAQELQGQLEALLKREQAARAEVERTSRMKDEFLATLSHELRTPLNAILGWSQLLGRDDNHRDQAALNEGLAIIERNARVQTQLIEDLLDMSRIISGKIRLDVQSVEAASFIDAAIETVAPAAEAKGITIQKVLDASAGPISGDPGRLQQVIWNLLSNAIKFTPRGGKVQVLGERANSQVQITVADTGQGISPEFLPYVFERFRQGDASTTRTHGGLGIGLAIVKQLVELHGGTIHATSAGEGKGSTFTVVLPVMAIRKKPNDDVQDHPWIKSVPPIGADRTSLDGLKVLVVDDEPDARSLIKRLLEERRAAVFTASTAAEGIALLGSQRPDVLISDIGMPGIDGYEFLRQVRSMGPDRGGKTPAIALTAFARSEDRTRALLAGYLVHIAKPVEPQELLATVASIGGRTGKNV